MAKKEYIHDAKDHECKRCGHAFYQIRKVFWPYCIECSDVMESK